MVCDVRVISSGSTSEIYITSAPTKGTSAKDQAEEVYSKVADVLRKKGARILGERIFATQEAIDLSAPIRSVAYGDLADGLDPVGLTVPRGVIGPIAGIQIHAVAGSLAPELIQLNGAPCGRLLDHDNRRYIILTGLTDAKAGSPPEQARSMFEQANAALKQAGGDMFAVARTWLWLGDILDWYDDLNRVRTKFFNEVGLLNGSPGTGRMPASTGIGIKPANEPICALDVYAVVGESDPISFFYGTDKQESAFIYGSAFARASRAASPAGETVFVSGTASIDDAGATIFVDDIPAQIDETFRCVRAVLDRTGCSEKDMVQSIIYCKTPEVEKVFMERYGDLAWPHIVTITDVCRDDLLFEIEATAAPGASRTEA